MVGREIPLADSSFACLALLEDETCQLFELMVKKAEDSETSLLLDIILQETRKHRELLKHLSRILKEAPIVSSQECDMGEWFKQALGLTRAIKAEIQQGMRVTEAARRLIDFEKGIGEEYTTEAHTAARALVQENQAVRKVLESIAAEEEAHAEILQLVTRIAKK